MIDTPPPPSPPPQLPFVSILVLRDASLELFHLGAKLGVRFERLVAFTAHGGNLRRGSIRRRGSRVPRRVIFVQQSLETFPQGNVFGA